jgi:hypothetical protein
MSASHRLPPEVYEGLNTIGYPLVSFATMAKPHPGV